MKITRYLTSVLASSLFLFGLVGCTHLPQLQAETDTKVNITPKDKAEQVIFKYFQALIDKRYDDAYNLIAPEFKAKIQGNSEVTSKQAFINLFGFWNYDNGVNDVVAVERLLKPIDAQNIATHVSPTMYIASKHNKISSQYPDTYRIYAVDTGYKKEGTYSQFAIKEVPRGSGNWLITEIGSVCLQCP